MISLSILMITSTAGLILGMNYKKMAKTHYQFQIAVT